MPSKVLIVEDDPNTVELIRLYLERDGYKVITASDGNKGLRLAREEAPDLIVLDLMLPGIDGMQICRTLREESEVPIIMLTARVEEEDRLAGLNQGADDYVTKPFSPKELTARVRAVLRRTARDAVDRAPVEISYEAVFVNTRDRRAEVNGKPLRLTPTEFRLLVLFLREPRRTFTRAQVLDHVYGYDFEGFDRAVDSQIYNLRKKLNVESKDNRYIQTVYGEGYRFSHA
ncbi:MAG: response regulator transcription factor [Chloroflexi bacterium]|nr:response regulator transcription factor [Chloroflexota bacterium]